LFFNQGKKCYTYYIGSIYFGSKTVVVDPDVKSNFTHVILNVIRKVLLHGLNYKTIQRKYITFEIDYLFHPI